MPRAIWTGIVSFGLVSIPVRVVSAVQEKDVRFHQFHQSDGGRIRYRRVCDKDGKEVDYDDIARGYEVAKGRFVLISEEELEHLEPEKTRRIDIEQFVDVAEIDPIYYDTTYYLEPGEGGDKPYRLLREAMAATGKAALGRFVMRDREHLVALRALGEALALETLLYADEVVASSALEGLPKGSPAARELRMAEQLVESLTDAFEPERFHDEFREKVEKLAEQKARGRKVVLEERPREETPVVDLMAALEKSLAAARRPARRPARKQRRSA